MKPIIKIRIAIIAVIAVSVWLVFYYNAKPEISVSPYPDGKNFAFTITDDPDGANLEKVKPIYEFLNNLGLKTTIGCWVYVPKDLSGNPSPEEQLGSVTLQDRQYLEFLQLYKKKGFEVSLHTVTSGNDKREDTIKGYERFKALFGAYPKINIMHSRNRENIYWGRKVFKNLLLRLLVGLYDKTDYAGENTNSPYFWGDVCKEKTKYVRLWGTSDTDTLKFNPSMPYHDNNKPFVNYWFSFSDGYSAKYFRKLISKHNIDRLVKERGASIVYAHLAAGFSQKAENGYALDETIKNELDYLASQKDSWLVPAGTLLDRLCQIKNISVEKNGSNLEVTNQNPDTVYGVTLVSRPFLPYRDYTGKLYKANEEGEILLGDLKSGIRKTIYIFENLRVINRPKVIDFFEQTKLVIQRIKIMLLNHRG